MIYFLASIVPVHILVACKSQLPWIALPSIRKSINLSPLSSEEISTVPLWVTYIDFTGKLETIWTKVGAASIMVYRYSCFHCTLEHNMFPAMSTFTSGQFCFNNNNFLLSVIRYHQKKCSRIYFFGLNRYRTGTSLEDTGNLFGLLWYVKYSTVMIPTGWFFSSSGLEEGGGLCIFTNDYPRPLVT
jgi:hypothetical protein